MKKPISSVFSTTRSLHIGTITYDWYPYEVRALRTAEAAIAAGYEVDVICLHQEGTKSYEVHNGVHIYRMPMRRGAGGSLLIRLLQWFWFLLLAGATVTWLHFRHPYDVIHVHNMPDFLVFAALLPKLAGAKVILDVQDISPELVAAQTRGRLRDTIVRLAMFQEHISTTFAHHVVTTGNIFAQSLLRRGVPQEKITNILNSADPHLFPSTRRCPAPGESAQGAQPFIIMYHGTLEKRNGLDIAIRALVQAHHVIPQVRLEILGRGNHMPTLKQLVAELDADTYIAFRDSCPPDKLVDFVVHGDVGIIPYRYDGFAELVLPTKAYEFAWMQRPIIASDTPAIRSMFRPESIMLCNPSSPDAFATAIIDLYQHPAKRAAMINNAFKDYIPYQWEFMATRYQQLLVSLCQK